MFSFKSISLLFEQFRVSPFTILIKQQQFAIIVIILYTFLRIHNKNYSIDLYNRDLQTQLCSSHATCLHTRLNEFFLNCQATALSYFLYCRINSLMNALERECLSFREISINVNNLFPLLLFEYILYICPCSVVDACLSAFFTLLCCCCMFTSLSLFLY